MDGKTRILKILEVLRDEYSDAPRTYLNFRDPYELLIATILSAHAAAAPVNTVTPALFDKYPTPEKLASASQEDVINIIGPVGTYNVKSKYILTAARQITETFGGKVPETLEDLITLQGVSRKTANVVLSTAFNKHEGIVVDTHIMRVSVRLGLSMHTKKPAKIERDLMALLPQELWGEYARLVSALGRRTCKARKPLCSECPVRNLCPSANSP
ncbi:MAG: endonuclease III [Candidatus Thorarchaeota archaeon]|nr:MAG: endonuclease III [Candidatus Thorarchaeota archaeon]